LELEDEEVMVPLQPNIFSAVTMNQEKLSQPLRMVTPPQQPKQKEGLKHSLNISEEPTLDVAEASSIKKPKLQHLPAIDAPKKTQPAVKIAPNSPLKTARLNLMRPIQSSENMEPNLPPSPQLSPIPHSSPTKWPNSQPPNSQSNSQRKIPGPLGNMSQLFSPEGNARLSESETPNSRSIILHTKLKLKEKLSISANDDWNKSSWVSVLESLKVPPFGSIAHHFGAYFLQKNASSIALVTF
jgi:hypothetical protein